MWVIAICFATPPRSVRTYPEGRTSALIIGLLAGLILGTKYSGVYYVLALGLLLISILIASPNPGQKIQIILLFSGGVLLMGGYWYLFNFVTFTNPLWPFEIKIANRIIFPGTIQISAFAATDSSLQVVGNMPFWERWWYTWSDHSALFSVDSRLGGFGPLWFIIGLPAIILWMIVAILRCDWWVLYIIGIHGTLLMLVPFNWMPRYTLFLVVLGGISVAALYNVLLPWTRLCLSILIVVGAILALFTSADHGYFSVQDIRYFQTLPPGQRSPVNLDPQRYGPGYQWFEHSIAPNAVVAYGNNVTLPYPLWNYTLEREVIAVTTIDSDQYVATLRAKGVHFVFLGTGGYQDAILSSDKQVHLIFEGDDGWKIFKVQ